MREGGEAVCGRGVGPVVCGRGGMVLGGEGGRGGGLRRGYLENQGLFVQGGLVGGKLGWFC